MAGVAVARIDEGADGDARWLRMADVTDGEATGPHSAARRR